MQPLHINYHEIKAMWWIIFITHTHTHTHSYIFKMLASKRTNFNYWGVIIELWNGGEWMEKSI